MIIKLYQHFLKDFLQNLFQCQGILIGAIDRYIHGFFIK